MGTNWDAANSLGNFACRMYGALDRTRNIFFSPHSVSAAMSLVHAGAKGRTAKQLAAAMDYPTDDPETTSALMSLAQLPGDSDIRLSAANAAWIQRGHAVLDEYRRRLGDLFRETDFAFAEAASAEINDWIAKHTNDLIRDLVPPEALGALTRLVLVNAIHFKGAWQRAFEADLTRKADFHCLDGRTTRTDMMAANGVPIRHVSAPEFEAAYLPYGDGSMSMLVIIPKDFERFSAELDGDRLRTIQGGLNGAPRIDVDLRLPKFKLESTMELGRVLAGLGAEDAFALGAADFSGITGDRELFIYAVLHKALVDVSEKGAEAAAATAVATQCLCVRKTVRFEANRSFIFAICRNGPRPMLGGGAPLFMGQVVSP
jgi:serpin B